MPIVEYIRPNCNRWGQLTKDIRVSPFSGKESTARITSVSSLQHEDLEELFFERTQPQSNTDVTFQIEAALKQIKKIEVDIPQSKTVRDYLLRYSDITSLISLVCSLAREVFYTDTLLSLEVYRDPEIEDEYLALYIRQESYEEGIMDKIEELCAEYEEELIGKSGWFIVTTDFRPPR